nr:peptidoglycan bridge formation glycyltransferase FemA/FemB family protein [Treponema sp.]
MFSFEITKLPDSSLEDSGSRFLQSPFWATFKRNHGWSFSYFHVVASYKVTSFSFNLIVLVRSFKKLFSLAYVPMGPELLENATNEQSVQHILESDFYKTDYPRLLTDLSHALRSFVPKNTMCIRYDIPLDFYTCDDRALYNKAVKQTESGIRKTKVDIQPPDTVLLDITPSTDDLLSNMKSKWRYNIRLAQKKGVVVKAYSKTDALFDSALDTYYDLYKTTAERDGIAIHTKSYYRDLFALSDSQLSNGIEAPVITLYLAEHEGDPLAGIITLFCKREAVYLYGASGNKKRNIMPAYLLQWTAIQDAKKHGCPVYDFYGIPPTDDENHPMHGLYLFKTGFGGKEIHRP